MKFDEALAGAEKAGAGGSHVIRHIANSAATLTLPQARSTWSVRGSRPSG